MYQTLEVCAGGLWMGVGSGERKHARRCCGQAQLHTAGDPSVRIAEAAKAAKGICCRIDSTHQLERVASQAFPISQRGQ